MAEKDAKKELRDKILRTFSDLTTVTLSKFYFQSFYFKNKQQFFFVFLVSVAFIIIYEFVEPYDRGIISI